MALASLLGQLADRKEPPQGGQIGIGVVDRDRVPRGVSAADSAAASGIMPADSARLVKRPARSSLSGLDLVEQLAELGGIGLGHPRKGIEHRKQLRRLGVVEVHDEHRHLLVRIHPRGDGR